MLSLLALALLAIPQTDAPAATPQPAAPATEAVEWAAQTLCPVSGEALDAEERSHYVDFEGQRIVVCCKKCVPKAAAEPEQMIEVLARAGQAPASINTLCPVTSEELEDRKIMVWVGNKSFAVCCQKCARKAAGTPAVYFDKLEGRGKQTLCPISGEKVAPRVAVDLEGYRVRACSEACLEKIQADPAAAFAKLAAQKVVLEPLARTCALNPKEKRDKKVFVTLGAKRSYFCCTKCRGKYLAKRAAPKPAERATAGALDFLGGGGR